jgi:hypothetical protein
MLALTVVMLHSGVDRGLDGGVDRGAKFVLTIRDS